MRMRRTMAVIVAATTLGLGGCAAAAPQPTADPPAAVTPTEAPPAPEVRDIVTGLAAVWSVVFLDDGTALASVRDTGEVLEIDPEGVVRAIGVVPGVVHGGEGGLLGLAVGPQPDVLYVYSTGSDGNRIQAFALEGQPGALALGAGRTILDGIPAAATHNGGRIAFGPDGMLYATTGDAGAPARAQDPASLAGKLLRMTPDGEVPDDNPLAGSLVYSLGHRNPQGLGWGSDGTLVLTEFGQNTWDELNIIIPGGNYGWPEVEGVGGDPAFIDPVQQWATDAASPSGLAVVDDTVYVANLRGEVLRAIPLDDPSRSQDLLAGEYGRLRAVTEAPDGTLWIVTNNTAGRGEPRDGDDRIVSIPIP
jgi:glucose/arabinose dehydrogenase